MIKPVLVVLASGLTLGFLIPNTSAERPYLAKYSYGIEHGKRQGRAWQVVKNYFPYKSRGTPSEVEYKIETDENPFSHPKAVYSKIEKPSELKTGKLGHKKERPLNRKRPDKIGYWNPEGQSSRHVLKKGGQNVQSGVESRRKPNGGAHQTETPSASYTIEHHLSPAVPSQYKVHKTEQLIAPGKGTYKIETSESHVGPVGYKVETSERHVGPTGYKVETSERQMGRFATNSDLLGYSSYSSVSKHEPSGAWSRVDVHIGHKHVPTSYASFNLYSTKK